MIKPSRGNASLTSQGAQGCQENLTILSVELYVSRLLKIGENTQNLHARASSWTRQGKPTGFARVLEEEKMRPDVTHLRGETHLCNLVKFPEELIQHVDQFPRGAVTCKSGEPNDVSV